MKLGVVGALGRMGQTIIENALQQQVFADIIGLIKPRTDPNVFDHQGPEVIYCADRMRVIRESDVVIDFSLPEAFEDLIEIIALHKTPYVLGTTGLTKKHLERLKEVSQTVPILQSYNMSLGVNLVCHLVEQTAEQLQEGFDVSIFDRHHRHKKDTPSGTALMLKEAILAAGSRKSDDIQVSSQRLGQVFGEHTVAFASHNEILEFKHTALNRHVFADGALVAAKWLVNQSAGYYTMRDVFKVAASKVVNFEKFQRKS